MAFERPNVCLPMCQIGFKSLVCRTASQMIVWSPNMGSLGSAVFGNVYPVVLRDGHSCCCWYWQMAEVWFSSGGECRPSHFDIQRPVLESLLNILVALFSQMRRLQGSRMGRSMIVNERIYFEAV